MEPSAANSPQDKKLVLGIRREDKNRWERRAPLAPHHVRILVERGIKVIIQPSSLRTFSDRQYKEVSLNFVRKKTTCSYFIQFHVLEICVINVL